VAATMRAEPVAMVREVRLKVRLQNGAHDLGHSPLGIRL
jgi:hypothetical protein